MIITLNPQKIDTPFIRYNFYNVLTTDIYDQACAELACYSYFKIEQTRISNPNRIWLNQTTGILKEISIAFNNNTVKSQFFNIFNMPIHDYRTRVELCMDSAGSWLEPHRDDPAKVITLQLYLTGAGNSTRMLNTVTEVVPNMAWAFDNNNQPVHSLSPLKNDRASIIVNYVTNDWRDKSVLV
jgi:hypothetical protein